MHSDFSLPDLPAWVSWLAQDADGCWWGFEAEPNEGHNHWYENEVGRCVRLAEGEKNRLWRFSLKKIK